MRKLHLANFQMLIRIFGILFRKYYDILFLFRFVLENNQYLGIGHGGDPDEFERLFAAHSKIFQEILSILSFKLLKTLNFFP